MRNTSKPTYKKNQQYARLLRGLVIFSCLFLLPSPIKAQFYSGLQMQFGKNRVQFHDFFWSHYRFEKYNVYFYRGGQKLAIHTAKYADKIIEQMENRMDFALDNPIQFIVYNKLSDLKESNIGLLSDDQYNIGGVTHIVGTKVILYFNGDHSDFEAQIRAGIVQIMLNQMMFGSQLGAMVKNSALIAFPEWYLQGLMQYYAEGWNTNMDNITKDGILSGRYEKFSSLTGSDATNAGHSIWHFVEEKYGTYTVPNIVYMSMMSRDIEDGFLYVLGISYENILIEWKNFYRDKYYDDIQNQDSIPSKHLLKRIKSTRIYDEIKLSPRGNHVAYTTNEYGKNKVWIYNLATHKKKCIMKAGYKLDQKIDRSYPMLEWHPTGRLLSIMVERKGSIMLYYYKMYTKKVKLFDKVELFHFDKITDFSYSFDGRHLVFSGVRKGQSDIYKYDLVAHSYEAITSDPYDDRDPVFINKHGDIVFSSNRPNANLDTEFNRDYVPLMEDNFDLYLFSPTKNPKLIKFTDTKFATEKEPLPYDNKYITFLSDKNGVYNRYIGMLDSSISFIDTITHYKYSTTTKPVTNYARNIETHDVSMLARKTANIFYKEGEYKMSVQRYIPADALKKANLKPTYYRETVLSPGMKIKEQAKYKTFEEKEKKKRFVNVYQEEKKKEEDDKIDIDEYRFDEDKRKKQGSIKLRDTTLAKNDTKGNDFKLSKKRNYNLEFNVNKLISQVDFSFLNTMYQPYTGGTQPNFVNPGFNGFIKLGIADLFEDYRVTGGVRISGDLQNNEYLLSVDNLKHRLDNQYVFYRRGFDSFDGYSIVNHKSHEVRYRLKWPFDQVISIRGSILYRNDKAVTLATDDRNLTQPTTFKNWTGLIGEIVYDDTRNRGVNIYFGSRAKIFTEYYKQIDEKLSDLIVLGADFRNYQQIHKNFIWANRFATSTSLGSQRLIYYMGGVDNWINLSRRIETFNNDTPIDQDINWAYQTIATNMRGFSQNIRNGNSFALVNSELRLPVFSYFINKPIKSDMIRNFQVVGFGDVGTAWTGPDPYSPDNSLYNKEVINGPIRVNINNLRDPIVYGYGFGVRTRLLGYFLRADYAWGIEDGIILNPIFYFSLSLDF